MTPFESITLNISFSYLYLPSPIPQMIIDPPQFPIHSGTLLSLDAFSMQWTRKYLVLTDDSIFIHGRRRVGFDAAQQHKITPNSIIFSTTLKPYSFEVVLFSESIHLAASSDTEKSEWMYVLHRLIAQSSYDLNDPLQAASLERVPTDFPIEFQCSSAPGLILDRRGHFAMASVVSESLSRKVSRGSILSSIDEDNSIVLKGFDYALSKLSTWKAPFQLTFWLSPQKMGWLTMMVTDNRKSWKSSKVVSWGEYVNLFLSLC